MSVRIATFKKLRATETYGCSTLEVQTWAKGLADLRIEFGKQRNFRIEPNLLNRPQIEGIVIASLSIDRQLKPALYFYPIPVVKYSPEVSRVFREQILGEVRSWLEAQLSQGDSPVLGSQTLCVELQGSRFKLHRLKSL